MLLTAVTVSFCQSQSEEAAYSQYNVDDQNYPYLLQLFQDLPSVERRNDFFLKASKSVPRIGRRESPKILLKDAQNKARSWNREDFFLKAAKLNPRVARRNDFFLKASKSVPRIGRRDDVDLLLSNNNLSSLSKRNDFLGMVCFKLYIYLLGYETVFIINTSNTSNKGVYTDKMYRIYF